MVCQRRFYRRTIHVCFLINHNPRQEICNPYLRTISLTWDVFVCVKSLQLQGQLLDKTMGRWLALKDRFKEDISMG